MKYILFIIIPLIALTGCKRETIELYEGGHGISFWHEDHRLPTEMYTQKESAIYSFMENDHEQDTVWVLVQASGMAADIDRPISLKQVNAGQPNAAVEGKHFKGFSQIQNLYYMPAGKVLTSIPVVLLRDESLTTTEYCLKMELVPNDYFDPGIASYNQFTVFSSDMLSMPPNWNTDWRTAFGTWSRVKMQFLIDYVTGRIDWSISVSYGGQLGYSSLAYIKWKEYVDEHGPLYDENDVEITFRLY